MLSGFAFSAEVSNETVQKNLDKKEKEVKKLPAKTARPAAENVQKFLDDKEKALNKPLAKVDEYVITQRLVNDLVASKLQKTFFHKNISKEKREEYNKEALQQLIDNELVYAYAKRNKISVKKEVLEEKKQEIIKKFKSQKEFEETLSSMNISIPELERRIEKAALIPLIYKEKIETNLNENDLKEYYEKNKFKFAKPESRKVLIISVNIDPGAIAKETIKASDEKINEAYEKVKSGEDFGAIAQKYSEDMYRIKGGDLGYIHKGGMEDVDDVAFSLKKGELSDIIKTDIAFYFLKIVDIKPEKQISFDASKSKLKKDLKTRLEKEKLQLILDSQKNLMKITIL